MEPNWTDIAQGVGEIAGAIIAVAGFYFVIRQIRQTNLNIEQSNHTAIYSISADFYKFLTENHDLRPYFYDNKGLEKKNPNYDRVMAVAEYLADFFEFILVQGKNLDPKIYNAWKAYMINIFERSPAFRSFLKENQVYYTTDLLQHFNVSGTSLP